MQPKIGDRAIYRPRVPTGRQSELFCFVTRVVDAERGLVDLVAFPAGGEFMSLNNVPPKAEATQIHCWEPHSRFNGDNSELLDLIAELEARVSALEHCL
jgi:hypothetical protein